MLLAHKIALDPNAAQRLYFARAAGTARFAYNYGAGRMAEAIQGGRQAVRGIAARQLNAIKREQYPWMFDVGKCAVQEAIIDLGTLSGPFSRSAASIPASRRRTAGRASVLPTRPEPSAPMVSASSCPSSAGCGCAKKFASRGPLKRATVSCEAGRWFVSLLVETPEPAIQVPPLDVVGVDLSVTTLATLSTGEAITGRRRTSGFSAGCAVSASLYHASGAARITHAKQGPNLAGCMPASATSERMPPIS